MFYVYLLTNKNNSVLYTGFTDNLDRRIFEHKNQLVSGFTSKYNCNKLVYFEEFIEKDEALHRERQLKRYRRSWKENLINENNPEWKDLYGNY
ncbi:MAG: GIY-YIG nuclease family protein [Fulvivirga sp.]